MQEKEKLAQEILLEHYKYPKNFKILENPDMKSGAFNPSCGDSVAFQAKIIDAKIELLTFQGSGCVISQATASILTVYATGKTIAELELLNAQKIMTLIGIELGPMRARCALLSLEALLSGIKNYVR